MIDFKDLDKTQIRFVERDCHCPDILNTICINNFNDANRILNNVVSDVIVEVGKAHPRLPFWLKLNEDDNVLNKIRKAIEYFEFEFTMTPQHAISRILRYGFNTKQHRALLTEIFGDKVHDEDFMANLQFVISKILYAILYV